MNLFVPSEVSKYYIHISSGFQHYDILVLVHRLPLSIFDISLCVIKTFGPFFTSYSVPSFRVKNKHKLVHREKEIVGTVGVLKYR